MYAGQRMTILLRLAAGKGAWVSEDALLFALYGNRGDGGPDAALGTLRAQVCRLRKMLPPSTIEHRRGFGYRIAAHQDAVARILGERDDVHVVLARTDDEEKQMERRLREMER